MDTPPTVPSPSIAERTIDTAIDVSRTIEDVTAGLKEAVDRLRAAVEHAEQPERPLAILRRLAREAPMTSLSIAFLLGVAMARRW